MYGSGPELEATRLFGRLPGRDGAAIQVEEQRGIMGLVLSGDIRALVYATQGVRRQAGPGLLLAGGGVPL